MSFTPGQTEIIQSTTRLIGEAGIQNLTSKNLAAAIGISNVGRMKKYPLALTFIGLSLGLGFLLGVQGNDPLLFILTMAFVGVAILTETKTAPAKRNEQYIYGALMALLIAGFYYLEVPNAAIMGMFVGNLGYFAWRTFGNKVRVMKAS